MIAAGLGVVVLYEKKHFRLPSYLICFYLIFSMNNVYGQHYQPAMKKAHSRDQTVYAAIKKAVPENKILMVLGLDWRPVTAYYSERKTIMVRWYNRANLKALNLSIKYAGENNIGGMLACKKYLKRKDDINDIVKRFDFAQKPLYKNSTCALYAKATPESSPPK